MVISILHQFTILHHYQLVEMLTHHPIVLSMDLLCTELSKYYWMASPTSHNLDLERCNTGKSFNESSNVLAETETKQSDIEERQTVITLNIWKKEYKRQWFFKASFIQYNWLFHFRVWLWIEHGIKNSAGPSCNGLWTCCSMKCHYITPWQQSYTQLRIVRCITMTRHVRTFLSLLRPSHCNSKNTMHTPMKGPERDMGFRVG